jgi:hypothetical protein
MPSVSADRVGGGDARADGPLAGPAGLAASVASASWAWSMVGRWSELGYSRRSSTGVSGPDCLGGGALARGHLVQQGDGVVVSPNGGVPPAQCRAWYPRRTHPRRSPALWPRGKIRPCPSRRTSRRVRTQWDSTRTNQQARASRSPNHRRPAYQVRRSRASRALVRGPALISTPRTPQRGCLRPVASPLCRTVKETTHDHLYPLST